jgi:signal transduction histidine kinase
MKIVASQNQDIQTLAFVEAEREKVSQSAHIDHARLSMLGEQLSGMLDPTEILPAMTKAICEALHVPYAAVLIRRIDTGEEELVSQHGTLRNELDVNFQTGLRFPMTHRGEALGSLVINTSDAARRLDEEELSLIREFVQRSGAAVRVVQLMEDLRRTRERLVLAREEERQLLRRNLHDGIGPTLAALIFRSGSLRKLIADNPAQAETQVAEYRDQLKYVITEIRRVVYNLRPPALDEIGMLRAIREQASQFSTEDLTVEVDAPDSLPVLHPAVEVAAYRIASEAMSNVARHAQANHCRVRIRVDDIAFLIEVQDNGKGLPIGQPTGVGLTSMRERTSELGGTLNIQSAPAQGTRVRACLPVNLSSWVDLEEAADTLNAHDL